MGRVLNSWLSVCVCVLVSYATVPSVICIFLFKNDLKPFPWNLLSRSRLTIQAPVVQIALGTPNSFFYQVKTTVCKCSMVRMYHHKIISIVGQSIQSEVVF